MRVAGTNRIVLHESADQQHIGSSGSGARDCDTEVTGSTLERSDVNILVSGRIGHAAADQLLSHTTEGRPNMWFLPVRHRVKAFRLLLGIGRIGERLRAKQPAKSGGYTTGWPKRWVQCHLPGKGESCIETMRPSPLPKRCKPDTVHRRGIGWTNTPRASRIGSSCKWTIRVWG